MIQNSARLDRKIMGEIGEETTNKSKHIKNNQSESRSFRVFYVFVFYVFGDASLLGTCAVAYAVIKQPSGSNNGLISSKSRLSKKQSTIPRLELVAVQMAENLAINIRSSLQNFNIREVYEWSDR